MYVWLTVLLLLTLIEVSTLNLVTIWFAISSLVTLIVSFFTNNLFIELLIFVVLGIILMITTRPVLKRYFDGRKVKTNIDRIIGMEGIVKEEISPPKYGVVKVEGKEWTAFSDKKINKDSVITVLEIEGVKLKVKEK